MEPTYLAVIAGDDKVLPIAVTDPTNNNAPVDVTGFTLWFYVKVRRRDADVDALIRKQTAGAGITITNAVGGLLEVAIAAADTATIPAGLYAWELQAKAAGSVTTLARGWLRLEGQLVVTTV